MKKYNILTPLAWFILGILIAILLGLCWFGCSSPFLKALNPTFTAQIQTPQGPLMIEIPAELPDFVTGNTYMPFLLVNNICMMRFSGITKDSCGNVINYYDLVIKCDTYKVIALRAMRFDTKKYWLYIEGIPVPASLKQINEEVEGLIGKGT